MKKITLALGLMLILVVSSAFADSGEVNQRVLESFKSKFSTAQEIKWVDGKYYYRAAFSLNGQNLFAYYSPDGELISMTRYISSLNLPLNLLTDLKNDYDKYWISDLFELSNNEGTHYYITLEDADAVIKLVSTNGSEWMLHGKKRKV
jgi:hypothetical protein